MFPDYTPEETKKINEALTKRQECDYKCFMLLRAAKRWIGYKPEEYEEEELEELRQEVEDAIDAREDTNDAFLRVVARR